MDSWVEDLAGLALNLHQDQDLEIRGLAGFEAQKNRTQTPEENDINIQENDSERGLGPLRGLVIIGSQNDLRASQVEGINLQVDLNPKRLRRQYCGKAVMANRKASKRPRTMAEAVQISLSEVVQDPTPQPLEDAQPSQVTQPSQAPHLPQPIQPPSNETAPETSMKKCGRGSAKGIHQWGTGSKLKVMFDNDFQPLGDEGTKLKGQLGTMLRNPHRVPLTYLDWNSVPEEIKSAIWKEVEMSANGENTDKMSVFIKTRDENDPDVKAVVVSNVASRQPIIRASVGNDFQDGDQGFSPLPAHSPQLDGQDGQKVSLVNYTIPKHDVAEGIVISKDPLVKVDGKSLGSDFWKVLVKKAKIPNASLERPRKKFRTVGEAVGCAVAWRSCDVCVCRGIKCAMMNKLDAMFWVPLILHFNRGSYFVEDLPVQRSRSNILGFTYFAL
ncbi:hypothetical protein RHMOL_Rhmol06G0004500 [Rhododendron molle]|uniref:Uncharacterized protein n=1 Tax=Rhododendron molle TaxID=49168 RepID=A0ACC0N7C2_RHOML|nr:hypothetical protein RHMOL_Rhmol06G0004500 [Rhododendron molle]